MNWLKAITAGAGLYDAKRRNDTTRQNLARTQEALAAAQDEINQGADLAYELISGGHAEAAAAILAGSEGAAEAILEWYGVAEDVQREFYRVASAKLQPFVDLGLSAFDEMASMLGIRNSQGQVVPYDIRDLEQTPGYQFQFDQGTQAVERSQVGRQLSGRAAKEMAQYGQGLASQYFNMRLGQLQSLGQFGAQAAGQQAQAALSTGQNIGQAALNTGTNLGNIMMREGESMANLHSGLATNLSNIEMGRSGALADIQLSGAQAANEAANARQENRTNLLTNTLPLLQNLSSGSSPLTRVPTTPRRGNYTASGNYAGGIQL
jgi:hypothetical protein